MTRIQLDDDTAERLQAAKIDDEDWSDAVDRVLNVYDAVRVEAYRDMGIDPLADREDGPDD